MNFYRFWKGLGKPKSSKNRDFSHFWGCGAQDLNFKDLLFDLEKKVESNLNELLSLREQNDELLDKNKSLINERNDLMLDLESLEEKFKALKIANTITGSENNINETRSEINSLIREIDLCISQLSE